MQTIVKLPLDNSVYPILELPDRVAEKITQYRSITNEILEHFSAFQNIITHINSAVKRQDVFYIKTFPEAKSFDSAEIRHFICFGKLSQG